jgi:hypothetical protein
LPNSRAPASGQSRNPKADGARPGQDRGKGNLREQQLNRRGQTRATSRASFAR